MRYPVLVELIGLLHESKLFVELPCIYLRFYRHGIRAEHLPDCALRRAHYLRAYSASPAHCDHAPDYRIIEPDSRREQSDISCNAVFVLELHVIYGFVKSVNILVGAVLFHYEHCIAQFQDLIQFCCRKLVKSLDVLFQSYHLIYKIVRFWKKVKFF